MAASDPATGYVDPDQCTLDCHMRPHPGKLKIKPGRPLASRHDLVPACSPDDAVRRPLNLTVLVAAQADLWRKAREPEENHVAAMAQSGT